MNDEPRPILGVGVACLDFIWQVPGFPAEDSKTQAHGLLVQGGGPVGTALVTIARLGLPAAYLGTLGDDPAGQAILAELEQERVGTALVGVIPGATSHIASILVSRHSGKRTVVWHPGSAPPPAPENLSDEYLRMCRFVHLDGHHPEAAIPIAGRARSLGIPVSLDAGSNYPWMEELVPLVDVLIGSERFARDLTGEDEPAEMAAALARLGPGIAGVTRGPAGGTIQAAGMCFDYPGFPVAAADTNGAGDVFHGAFLAGLASGTAPREAATYASAAAALKCTAPGGRTGIPDHGRLISFLAARGMLPDLRAPGA